MKSIYQVILSIGISILSQSVFALNTPAGLNPGDQFYVMFKSTSTTTGDKTVIEYNDLVNADATASSIGPASGLTWSALMNHQALDMSTGFTTSTEQTLSLFAANTAAPVYTTAGGQIAANRADLFDGVIDTAISYEADGVTSTNNTVWTGSDDAGVVKLALGSEANTSATEGIAFSVDITWIENTGPHTKTYDNSSIYAVSPLLRVASSSQVVPVIAATAVNDAGTVTVNASVDIDVLANDSDVDIALTIITVALQSQPANGAVVVNPANGVITYTPVADYTGSDSFTYLVQDSNDANLNSNIATVSITVKAAPAASGDSSGGAMDWSLLMFFLALSLLRVKVRK